MGVLTVIGEGFKNAFLMAWTVWWALVFGFAISAIVQAWVPRERIQNAMGGSGFRPVAVLTVIGEGFKNAFLMAWTVWWALVFGFAISAIVQAWVPRSQTRTRV